MQNCFAKLEKRIKTHCIYAEAKFLTGDGLLGVKKEKATNK